MPYLQQNNAQGIETLIASDNFPRGLACWLWKLGAISGHFAINVELLLDKWTTKYVFILIWTSRVGSGEENVTGSPYLGEPFGSIKLED